MGLLSGDALPKIFHRAFRSVYADGTLLKLEESRNRNGTLSSKIVARVPIKVQLDAVTERMSQAQGAAYTDKRVLILRGHLDHEINSDDQILAEGKRWRLNEVTTDPARAYYEARGSLSPEP